MTFLLCTLLLVLIGTGIFTLRAVGTLVMSLHRTRRHVDDCFRALSKQTAADAETNLLQHRIDRSYIGNELLEKRVLPTIGWKEPEKTPVQEWMLETWNREVADEQQST